MRIGFNATLLSGPGGSAGYRRSGIARYLHQLLQALPSALGEDTIVVVTGRGVPPIQPSPSIQWHNAVLPLDKPPLRISWEQTILPIAARRHRLDLFHGTVNVLPRGLPCPTVVTIHDLAFLRWPEQVPKQRYRYLATGVRDAVRRATRVIAVSEATKADIVELLQVDPDRISVTPLGVDQEFGTADVTNETPPHPRPYVLSVGNLEPRKNLPALLRAFASIKAEAPHDLILVGGEGWLTGEIHGTIRKLDLGERVHMTGYVEDKDLARWYRGADLFVLPSLYEGFGLPILEAMTCGTPVLTANRSAMPEVAGDAALLVDPGDDRSIATGMVRLLTDAALADDFRRRGAVRAAAFTWERTAVETVAVYRRAREEAR